MVKRLSLVVTPQDAGAKANGRLVSDGAITSATRTFSSASGRFRASDVGKGIFVKGAGVGGTSLTATIIAYVNSTTVTLSRNASKTVSGARAGWGTDDGQAFRNTAALLEAAGGGILSVPTGAGLYRLASCDLAYEIEKDEYCVFNLGSNVEIRFAKGASLWLDGAALGASAPFNTGKRFNFIGTKRGTRNTGVYGGDFTTGGWTLDIAFRSVSAVVLQGDTFTIDGIICRDLPGRNAIKVGYNNQAYPAFLSYPFDGLIQNCVFQNGSKNVPGNTIADDCSFVYINGSGTRVLNNVFKNDATAVTNCGGVELHSSNCVVSENTFQNLLPAMYVGVQDGTYAEHNSITHNRFKACKGAVSLADKVDGLTISANTFLNCSDSPNWTIMSTRDDRTGATVGDKRNVVISGNSFRESTRQVKAEIRVAGLHGSLIVGNTFDGMSDPIEFPLASNYATDGVSVTDNIQRRPVVAPGQGTGLALFTGSDGKWSGLYKNVLIQHNRVEADAGTSSTAVVAAAGNRNFTTYTNIVARSNTVGANVTHGVLGSLASSVEYTP